MGGVVKERGNVDGDDDIICASKLSGVDKLDKLDIVSGAFADGKMPPADWAPDLSGSNDAEPGERLGIEDSHMIDVLVT